MDGEQIYKDLYLYRDLLDLVEKSPVDAQANEDYTYRILSSLLDSAVRPLKELENALDNLRHPNSKWSGAVKSLTSGHDRGRLLDAVKEKTHLAVLADLLITLNSTRSRLDKIERRLSSALEVEEPLTAPRLPIAGLAIRSLEPSEEEKDRLRLVRRDSMKKDGSLFRNPGETSEKSAIDLAHGKRRRGSIDEDLEVADYHAVINGLAEPYDRFLWRGSVCIPAPPGKTHAVWHPVKIKLDTGSDFNVISRRVLTSLKFQSGYDDPQFKTAITLDTAHMQQFEERVSLSFTFDMWPFTLYETFYVRDGAQIDLLIGHETISAENLVQIRQDVVNHLRWTNRSKLDREEMQQNRKKAIEEADREREAALRVVRPAANNPSSDPSTGPTAPSSMNLGPGTINIRDRTDIMDRIMALQNTIASSALVASGALSSDVAPAYLASSPQNTSTTTSPSAMTPSVLLHDPARPAVSARPDASLPALTPTLSRPSSSAPSTNPGTAGRSSSLTSASVPSVQSLADDPSKDSLVQPLRSETSASLPQTRRIARSTSTASNDSPSRRSLASQASKFDYPKPRPRAQVDAYYSDEDLPNY